MTRDEMRTFIRDLIQLDNTTELPDATIDMYLDEGYEEVAGRDAWEWANVASPIDVDTVAGTASYAVAAADRIVAVTNDTQNYPLTKLSRIEYLRNQSTTTTQTSPTHFNVYDGFLYLWPTPGSVEQIYVYYLATPTFGTLASSEPAWDSLFHSVLVDWAMHRLWEREEDFERSDMYRARFEAKLGRMSTFYNRHTAMRPLVYGAGSSIIYPTNQPWLSDAANGGAT